MEQFVGQVIAVGFNFAPEGWHLCNGDLLSIGQYQALYTLIGTTYGGDGVNTFAVPNLNGRSPLGIGTQSGGPTYVLGQVAGTETVTLNSTQMPQHTHLMNASTIAATASVPNSSMVLGATPSGLPVSDYAAPPGNTTLAPASISQQGGSQPHNNLQPFNTVNYIIALFGVYPSQS